MSENKSAAKRIAMENLKPGMVLARDLTDARGGTILPSETKLNKENFNIIMLNSHQYVFVLEDSIDAGRPSFLELEFSASEHIVPVDIPLAERRSFKAFQESYDESQPGLESEFKRISEGGRVNADRLLQLTDNMLNKLRSKSDILLYISHMQQAGEYLHAHSVNVALLANLFGVWINASQEESDDLTIAGLLHDIGMTQLPENLVGKAGPLTKEERETLKKHTTLGYRMLDYAGISNEIKLAALGHHEKMNGQGYPLGIKGDKISKFARIIHICDVYEAMTSDRLYRERICPFEAIKQFERSSFGVFDTEALLLFLNNIAYTYLNSRVKLTDGTLGHVVFINDQNLSSPIIRTDEGEMIDLSENKELRVLCLVS